jgi:hypothetical protein
MGGAPLPETLMLIQFLVGTAVSLVNITIHSLFMTTVVVAARSAGSIPTQHRPLLLTCVMIASAFVLMVAHTCEVVVWALAYLITDAVPAGSGLIYFAFVNYTTLGYGDVTPREDWQLLGPMTAMNGVLLFGWSTAVIFQVLSRAMARSEEIVVSQ